MPPKIVYYVAISVDGFIAGPAEDVSAFVAEGNGVQQYLEDLQQFHTVVMGRKTYEFGYKFGLKPGQKAYSHMKHFIFSESLKLPEIDPDVVVCSLDLQEVEKIKANAATDIYLCGGGELAAWFLKNKLIDVLKIKLNPFISGSGIPLFSNLKNQYSLEWESCQSYDGGLQIITYNVKY